MQRVAIINPIICITCPHYAEISQSWGGSNQGEQGTDIPFLCTPHSMHFKENKFAPGAASYSNPYLS